MVDDPPPPPPTRSVIDYRSPDERQDLSPSSVVGAGVAWFSLLAAITQYLWICGSPRILLFHASDAAPAYGPFTRVDRLCFLIPAVLAIVLGLVALRLRKPDSAGSLGILLGFLSLLLVQLVGFSK
jgi:hypothetical protein